MVKEKQFYLDCLKDGKQRHDNISKRMKDRFETSATLVRNALIAEGYIKESGFKVRKDGKRSYFYELTGKKVTTQKEAKKSNPYFWEDGSVKSQGNAFNWQSYAKGIYKPGEIAAQEAGRKFGINSSSKQILPRVMI